MTDPADLSAADLVGHFRARTLSPLEAVRAVLERIDAAAFVFNAFRLVDAEGALAQPEAPKPGGSGASLSDRSTACR